MPRNHLKNMHCGTIRKLFILIFC